MTSIYLDACCLNRPFDNQLQPRIHLEAVAILVILGRVERGELRWVGSDVLDLEIARNPDPERRARTKEMLALAGQKLSVTVGEERRARELVAEGLAGFDALHVACAEGAHVDVFLTTDDRLLAQCARLRGRLALLVDNPLHWLEEAKET